MKFALDRDLYPHKLQVLRQSLNDRLPFEDESQDFVYEVGAFTYMIDKQAVFNEIFRVLLPGGTFCYNDWTVLEGFDPSNKDQVHKLLLIKKFSGLIELHNPPELAALAEQADFEVLWNGHGGYGTLIAAVEQSFCFADNFMAFVLRFNIMPQNMRKFLEHLRPDGSTAVLKESMDEKWLDVGHVFLIQKPLN